MKFFFSIKIIESKNKRKDDFRKILYFSMSSYVTRLVFHLFLKWTMFIEHVHIVYLLQWLNTLVGMIKSACTRTCRQSKSKNNRYGCLWKTKHELNCIYHTPFQTLFLSDTTIKPKIQNKYTAKILSVKCKIQISSK
jgi:hypothetical protein